MLKIARLTPNAILPVYGSAGAAGADLVASEDCVVQAKSRLLVKTGICVAIPPGHYGRVAPRSGLALKHFIDVGAGVIDADYRGEVGVLLFNFSDNDFPVYFFRIFFILELINLGETRRSNCPVDL